MAVLAQLVLARDGGYTPPDTSGTITHGSDIEDDGSNVGITGAGLVEADLTASGSFTTSENGQTIERLYVSGRVTIEHDNVTIRECLLESSGLYPLVNNATGLVIEDTEIRGASDSVEAATGAGLDDATLRRVHIHHVADGVKMSDDVLIEDSLIDQLWRASGDHVDCISVQSGANSTVRRSKLLCNAHDDRTEWLTSNAAVFMQTYFGPITGMTYEDCYLDGGGYTFYAESSTSGSRNGPVSSLTVTGCVFGGNYRWGIIYPNYDESEITWTNNTLPDGTAVTI